jgi:hypothetical protein
VRIDDKGRDCASTRPHTHTPTQFHPSQANDLKTLNEHTPWLFIDPGENVFLTGLVVRFIHHADGTIEVRSRKVHLTREHFARMMQSNERRHRVMEETHVTREILEDAGNPDWRKNVYTLRGASCKSSERRSQERRRQMVLHDFRRRAEHVKGWRGGGEGMWEGFGLVEGKCVRWWVVK